MAFVVKDRIKVTAAAPAQGTITLGSAELGYQTFAAIGDGNSTYYAIQDLANNLWEVGEGTYTHSGTTLSRDSVLSNSAGTTNKIDFQNAVEVFVTTPAAKSVHMNLTDDLEINGDVTFTSSNATDQVLIKNTNTGTSAAPDLVLWRDSSGAANADSIGRIDFRGEDDGSTARNYTSIESKIVNVAASTPTGAIHFKTLNASTTEADVLVLSGNAATFSGDVTINHGSGATTGVLNIGNANGNGTLAQINMGHSGDPDHGNISYTGSMVFKTGANATALTLDGSQNSTFAGSVTANAGVVVDNITIDGTEIDLSSGDLTIDVAGDIIFDSDAPNWRFKDNGDSRLEIGVISNGPSFYTPTADADMYFRGNDSDGGGAFTALTLDMSNSGFAFFNANAHFNESGVDTDFRIKSVNQTNMFYVDASTDRIGIGTATPDRIFTIRNGGPVVEIDPAGASSNPIYFNYNRSTSAYLTPEYWALGHKFMYNGGSTALEINSSGNATFAGNVALADDKKVTFGAGSDLEIYHDNSSTNDGIIKYQNENGHLKILSGVNGNGGIEIKNRTDNETYMTFVSDGAATIYHNNTVFLTSNASSITLSNPNDTDDAQIFLGANNRASLYSVDGSYITLKSSGSSGNDDVVSGTVDSYTYLYHNGSYTFRTEADGARVVNASNNNDGILYLGNTYGYIYNDYSQAISIYNGSNDPVLWGQYNQETYIYYNGSSVVWTGSNGLHVRSSSNAQDGYLYLGNVGNTYIQNDYSAGLGILNNGDWVFWADNDASTFLYHNNNWRFKTTNAGITINGALATSGSDTAYGASGQVLTSNGSSSPTWQDAAGGAWEHVSFTNFSGASTLEVAVARGYYYRVEFHDHMVDNSGGSRRWEISFYNQTHGWQRNESNNYLDCQGFAVQFLNQSTGNWPWGTAQTDSDMSFGSHGFYGQTDISTEGGNSPDYGVFEFFQADSSQLYTTDNNYCTFRLDTNNSYWGQIGTTVVKIGGTNAAANTTISKFKIENIWSNNFRMKAHVTRLKRS